MSLFISIRSEFLVWGLRKAVPFPARPVDSQGCRGSGACPVDGNMFTWEFYVTGPDEETCPFHGYKFKVIIEFPTDFPTSKPTSVRWPQTP
jgi:ubiquitin-protein ligase